MISKHEISGASVGGAAIYYEKAFSTDGNLAHADNYYLSEKAQSLWQGQGAVLLGIHGQQVGKEQFAQLLSGKVQNPATGSWQEFPQKPNGKDRRAGIDFTVTPPKSVSIMALAPSGDPRIIDAHIKANALAMQYFEQYGAAIRNSKGEHIFTKNLVYASVVHETNRANEPNLHTHNVVNAITYDHDGQKWRSLTNDHLYTMRTTVDLLYKRELAQSLLQMGYELNQGKGGDFEIAGISKEVINAFSSRSAQKAEKLAQWGIDPQDANYAQRQSAVLASRSAKEEYSKESLFNLWGEKLSELKVDLAKLIPNERSVSLANSSAPEKMKMLTETEEQLAALKAVAWSAKHLGVREQAFRHDELLKHSLRFTDNHISLAAISNSIEQYLSNQSLIEKRTPKETLYTTTGAIRTEYDLLECISAGKGQSNLQISQAQFRKYLTDFEAHKTAQLGLPYALSYEQANAAYQILLNPDQFQLIQGDAGTGKTAALAFVEHVCKAQQWEVIGLATTASAAKELESGSGIQSYTVARFLADRNNQIALLREELRALKEGFEGGYSFTPDRGKAITIERIVQKGNWLPSHYVVNHQSGQVYSAPSGLLANFGFGLLSLSENWQEKIGQLPPTKDLPGRDAMKKDPFRGQGEIAITGNSILANWNDPVLKMRTALLNTARKWGTALTKMDLIDSQVSPYHPVSMAKEVQIKAQIANRSNAARRYLQKQFALTNLEKHGNTAGKKMLIVMDESSMTGISDMEKVSALGRSFGAKVVFQGDIKQHRSVAAGKAFEQMQKMGINTAHILETRRFNEATAQTKRAIALMKKNRFAQALESIDTTIVKTDERLASDVAKRYLENLTSLQHANVKEPSIGVITSTNVDRKEINLAIAELLRKEGVIGQEIFTKAHLDHAKLTPVEQRFVSVLQDQAIDTITFRKNYREVGIAKGDTVRILSVDRARNLVLGQTEDGKQVQFNPKLQDLFNCYRNEQREYSIGQKIETRNIINLENGAEIANGSGGKIVGINQAGAMIAWNAQDSAVEPTFLTNEQLKLIDLAYARTSIREQGATNHVEIWAVSTTGAKVYDKAAQYVALTRAKHHVEIVTSDRSTLLKRAGMDSQKTSALEVKHVGEDRMVLDVDMIARPLTQELSQAKPLHAQHESYDSQILKVQSSQYGGREVLLPESISRTRENLQHSDMHKSRSSTKERAIEGRRANMDRGMER